MVSSTLSAIARLHDNAVVETIFGTFKKEEVYCREYTSEQSFHKSVKQYTQFYNEVRAHQTLKYQTPWVIEEKHRAECIENLCSNNVQKSKKHFCISGVLKHPTQNKNHKPLSLQKFWKREACFSEKVQRTGFVQCFIKVFFHSALYLFFHSP